MRTADFDYALPADLIAQAPAEPRDSARMLVLHRERATGDGGRVMGDGGRRDRLPVPHHLTPITHHPSPITRLEHRRVRDLPEYLRPGDVLVANDTRVVPAKLHAQRVDTGQPVEVLLLGERAPGEWEALAKPIRRFAPGAPIAFGGGRLNATVLERTRTGEVVLRFEAANGSLAGALDELGEVPLPPYIHRPVADPERYQTVYARRPGAVAAPTAGLHFTPELLARLDALGVERAYVTLHVGLYTFRSVLSERIEEHEIHREWIELPAETAETLNRARGEGRRIVAVGTTTVRVLETAGRDGFPLRPYRGWSQLFITPGYRFRVVDALLTNFHMPRTTLLMLVSALASPAEIREAYRVAVERRYRFYSFGDAMLIL